MKVRIVNLGGQPALKLEREDRNEKLEQNEREEKRDLNEIYTHLGRVALREIHHISNFDYETEQLKEIRNRLIAIADIALQGKNHQSCDSEQDDE